MFYFLRKCTISCMYDIWFILVTIALEEINNKFVKYIAMVLVLLKHIWFGRCSEGSHERSHVWEILVVILSRIWGSNVQRWCHENADFHEPLHLLFTDFYADNAEKTKRDCFSDAHAHANQCNSQRKERHVLIKWLNSVHDECTFFSF